LKLILSRKGFDSSAGGCPSPILPDGSLLSLPIPDARSRIRYGDLRHGAGICIGRLVGQLTRGRWRSSSRAHLDPDLLPETLPRDKGWRPVLGQTGAAQGHLREQQVKPGDLFLFFGLFRPVVHTSRRWQFVTGEPARHVIWAWLQIGEILAVDALTSPNHQWLRYHPHCHGQPDRNNTVYLASESLVLDGQPTGLPGAGTLRVYDSHLSLTRPQARLPSEWLLPGCFHPDGSVAPLSYHARSTRWQRAGDQCHLRAVSRGQEFVTELPPDALPWLRSLLTCP